MQQGKRTGYGKELFSRFIESNELYVDKTMFLRKILVDSGSDTMLFTRPRRFGKTLAMTMLMEFLQLDFKKPGSSKRQERLFKGLAVMGDRDLCSQFMGQVPKIFLSLKDVQGRNFPTAMDMMADYISVLAGEFDFLLESKKLDDDDKDAFRILKSKSELLKGDAHGSLANSIFRLAALLHRHFGRKVAVIIDEYDVPLAKAQENGYHDLMVDFYTRFFGILKMKMADNPISKIVLTGCLRVAKNGIFSGANNFRPNTVLSKDSDFTSFIGFTAEETASYLGYFGLSKYMGRVRRNYDGYRFGKEEIFCPWDIALFANDATRAIRDNEAVETPNYWIGSESTNTKALKKYVGFLSVKDNQNLQDLSDGKRVAIEINDSMSYDSLDSPQPNDFWSLLLHTGYLTAVRKYAKSERYLVKIPNAEIKKCFDDSIKSAFLGVLARDNGLERITRALLSGDRGTIEKVFQEMLLRYVSLRNGATRSRSENFYEGFVLGVLAACGSALANVKSEAESGEGYADIKFTNPQGNVGVVIELKSSKGTARFEHDMRAALAQIEKRKYAADFIGNSFVRQVYGIAVACSGKSCAVEVKALKGGDGQGK